MEGHHDLPQAQQPLAPRFVAHVVARIVAGASSPFPVGQLTPDVVALQDRLAGTDVGRQGGDEHVAQHPSLGIAGHDREAQHVLLLSLQGLWVHRRQDAAHLRHGLYVLHRGGLGDAVAGRDVRRRRQLLASRAVALGVEVEEGSSLGRDGATGAADQRPVELVEAQLSRELPLCNCSCGRLRFGNVGITRRLHPEDAAHHLVHNRRPRYRVVTSRIVDVRLVGEVCPQRGDLRSPAWHLLLNHCDEVPGSHVRGLHARPLLPLGRCHRRRPRHVGVQRKRGRGEHGGGEEAPGLVSGGLQQGAGGQRHRPMHGPEPRAVAGPVALDVDLDRRNDLLHQLLGADAWQLRFTGVRGWPGEVLVRQLLQDLVLSLGGLVDDFEHLIALGPNVGDLAAAEASAAPKEEVCSLYQVDDRAGVVQRAEESQHHALHLRTGLAGHELGALGPQRAEGQVDEVPPAQGLSLGVGGLEQQRVPEPEDAGSGHIGGEPPHEGPVEHGGDFEAQACHAEEKVSLVVGQAALQEVHILHGAAAGDQAGRLALGR
mmetsp:Transcript_138333/g.327634  ORF Transcript_138333/g.327634 Transcript_138333/m.327634 type:complete len:543 (-) Transcript_138333:5585-7213(-)